MFRTFENLIDPFAPFEERTPPANYWAYLRAQLVPFRRIIPWMMLTGLIVAVADSWLIFYAGRLVDQLNATGPATFWGAHGLELMLMGGFVLAIRPLLIMSQRLFLEQTLAGNLQDQTRWRAHKHMLGQSSAYFQNDFAGRLANRVMQLGPAVEDTAYMVFEGIWFFIAFVVAASLMLAGTDWRLAVPMLAWTAIFGSYVWWIATRVSSASERWSRARSMVTGRVVDSYTNIESVKLFAHNQREEDYARFAMRRHRVRFHRFLRLMTELSVGLNVIVGLLFVGVIGPAIWLWLHQVITVGEVAVAVTLTLRMNSMSGWIMWVGIQLFERAGTIREGLESVSVAHGVTDAPGARVLSVPTGGIVFDAVSHHYGKGKGGLDRISLTIPGGQRVGLVGQSGAGKSTLVNLLLRFHDTERGRILIDGQDIAQMTQESLRGAIGMVTQDSSLLHRSVRDNIRYGRPEATEAEIVAAARQAEAHDFILTLEDPKGRRGYDAHVGERGVKLSGGQRQRVALARVILKNAPILVLDEATSALDSEVEAAIQSTLYGVMEGKTVIAIAHRLSTIARMDRIVVLERGRIAEDGSHADLLARGGLYARFWNRQSGGFIGLDAADSVAAAE